MKKWQKAAIGVAVVAALAVGIVSLPLGIQSGKAADPYAGYEQITPTRGSLSVVATGNGYVTPAKTQTLYAPATGKVQTVLPKEGETVAQGDVLAILTSDALTGQLDAARAELDKQNKALENASLARDERYVNAPVKGKVKLVAAKGDRVDDLREKFGALAYIAQSDAMLVTLDASPDLPEDLAVTVVTAQGERTGTVVNARNAQGKAEIQVTGEDLPIQGVTVKDANGVLGQGLLLPLRGVPVLCGQGSIAKVDVTENKEVSVGTRLFTLEKDYASGTLERFAAQRAALDAYQALADKQEQLVLRAPFDGVISQISAQEGAIAQENQALFTLQSSGQFEVVAAIDEMDIAFVEPGQQARITMDAIKEGSFGGVVTRKSAAGSYAGGVTTFDVTLAMDDSAQVLAGMSAKVNIDLAKRENALLLPKRAVAYQQGKPYVLTTQGEQFVQLGMASGDQVEILSGLSEGQVALVKQAKHNQMEGFGMGRDMMAGGGN